MKLFIFTEENGYPNFMDNPDTIILDIINCQIVYVNTNGVGHTMSVESEFNDPSGLLIKAMMDYVKEDPRPLDPRPLDHLGLPPQESGVPLKQLTVLDDIKELRSMGCSEDLITRALKL